MSKKKDPVREKHEQLQNNLKYQLSVQRTQLKLQGILDLRQKKLLNNKNFPSLEDLGTQKSLKTLLLQETMFESLETLPPQTNLQYINADGSQLSSYTGLSRHPKLHSVSFLDTPLSEDPNYRLSLLIVIGQRLTMVDGVPITQQEKKKASKYPLIARYLIEAGWEVVDPCPSIDSFREIAIEKRLKFKGVDRRFENDEAQKYFKPPLFLIPRDVVPKKQEDDFEDVEEDVEEFEEELKLAYELRSELHHIGINIQNNENMTDEIIGAIKSLAHLMESLNPVSDILFKEEEEESERFDDQTQE